MSSYYEKMLATGEVKCIDEEIPFEIPKGWEWCRLVEVGKTETGTTPSKSHPEYFGDYIPFLGPANILNSKIVSVTQGLSDIGVDYGRIVPKNTILQVCIGGSIGKCAITDKPVTFNQQINSITPYLCNVEFVHIVLQSEYFRLTMMDKATGTATPIINRGNWETLLFPLPPINEQERIVANITELTHFLGIYSNKQEELNKLNSNMYQRLKKAILQEAIQGKLVPQIEEEGTAQELLEHVKAEKQKLVKEGKLKKSALNDSVIFRGDDNKYYEKIGENCNDITDEIPFDLPYNWCWCRFSNIVSMTIGKTPARGEHTYWINGKYNWVSISDMVDGGSISTTKEKVSDLAVKEVFSAPISEKGSLLMSFKLSIGKTSILDIDAYHNEAIITIRPVIDKEYATRNYLFRVLPLIANLGESKDAIKGKTMNSKSLANLLIPLPPLLEQKRIIEKIDQLMQLLK